MHPIPYPGECYSILAALLWAMAVVLFRRSGQSLRPLALNFLKGSVACVLFLGTLLVLGEDLLPPLPRAAYLRLALSGLIGLTVADTLFLFSLNRVGAGISQIIGCLYSPSVIAFSVLLLGERPSAGDLSGTGLILAGVLLSVARRAPTANQSRPQSCAASLPVCGVEAGAPNAGSGRSGRAGVLVGAASFALMALGVVIAKPALEEGSILWATAFRLLVGTVALAAITPWLRDGRYVWRALRPSRAWRIAVPAAVIGTYLAMLAWLAGIKYATASTAAILNQTSAVFVLPLAALLLHEPITRRKVMALGLALGGVALVTFL